jgi:hypothetical protein
VIEAGTFHHGPTCMITRIRPTAQYAINQNSFKTPIDELSSRSFLIQTRNFLQGPEHDARFRERNAVVRNQANCRASWCRSARMRRRPTGRPIRAT